MSSILISMNLSHPWVLIRSPIDIEVLRVLRGTTRALTGREVARLVRTGSQPTVNASLRRLNAEGLAHAREAVECTLAHPQSGAPRRPRDRAACRHPRRVRAPPPGRDGRLADPPAH